MKNLIKILIVLIIFLIGCKKEEKETTNITKTKSIRNVYIQTEGHCTVMFSANYGEYILKNEKTLFILDSGITIEISPRIYTNITYNPFDIVQINIVGTDGVLKDSQLIESQNSKIIYTVK